MLNFCRDVLLKIRDSLETFATNIGNIKSGVDTLKAVYNGDIEVNSELVSSASYIHYQRAGNVVTVTGWFPVGAGGVENAVLLTLPYAPKNDGGGVACSAGGVSFPVSYDTNKNLIIRSTSEVASGWYFLNVTYITEEAVSNA